MQFTKLDFRLNPDSIIKPNGHLQPVCRIRAVGPKTQPHYAYINHPTLTQNPYSKSFYHPKILHHFHFPFFICNFNLRNLQSKSSTSSILVSNLIKIFFLWYVIISVSNLIKISFLCHVIIIIYYIIIHVYMSYILIHVIIIYMFVIFSLLYL